MTLTTSVLYDGAVAVIVVDGELDLAVTDPLHQAVTTALTDGFHRLVLDVSRLRFCDSCGLGSILRAHRSALARNGSLLVAGATGSFARLLQVTAMDEVLTLVDDVGQALDQVQTGRPVKRGATAEGEA